MEINKTWIWHHRISRTVRKSVISVLNVEVLNNMEKGISSLRAQKEFPEKVNFFLLGMDIFESVIFLTWYKPIVFSLSRKWVLNIVILNRKWTLTESFPFQMFYFSCASCLLHVYLWNLACYCITYQSISKGVGLNILWY